MNEKFKPARALDARAEADENEQTRHQKRVERVGKRLARNAIRLANKGLVETEVPSRTRRIGLTVSDPAYFAEANKHLAEQGLSVTHRRDLGLDHHDAERDLMTIHALPEVPNANTPDQEPKGPRPHPEL